MKLLSNLDFLGKGLSAAICFCSVLFVTPINVFANAAIYIHDLSGVDGYADKLKTIIEERRSKGAVIIKSFSDSNPGPGHNLGSNVPDDLIATKDSLLNTGGEKVDWIIYIGHGSSATGKIPGNLKWDEKHKKYVGTDDISPGDLQNNERWKGIKGILIFGCAVIDIGDFGWQQSLGKGAHGIPAHLCDKYVDTNISNIPLPDKGMLGNYCRKYYAYSRDFSKKPFSPIYSNAGLARNPITV
jgi:hypothetical protein